MIWLLLLLLPTLQNSSLDNMMAFKDFKALPLNNKYEVVNSLLPLLKPFAKNLDKANSASFMLIWTFKISFFINVQKLPIKKIYSFLNFLVWSTVLWRYWNNLLTRELDYDWFILQNNWRIFGLNIWWISPVTYHTDLLPHWRHN